MSDWQPIARAPKDGLVLVCGQWDGEHECEGTWWGLGACCDIGVYGDWNDDISPTHWMPLPAHPASCDTGPQGEDPKGLSSSGGAVGSVADETPNPQGQSPSNNIVEALKTFIYETTHLSPVEEDGSHWCKISKDCLRQGRAALSSLPPHSGEDGHYRFPYQATFNAIGEAVCRESNGLAISVRKFQEAFNKSGARIDHLTSKSPPSDGEIGRG
jgi:hypothetical protein